MSKPFTKIKYTGWLGLDSQLTFGKFIGWIVLDVVKYHPGYISYLLDKTDIKFNPSVAEEVIRLKKPDTNYNIAYHQGLKYMPGYDHDTLSDWSDWHTDVPF